MFPDTGDSTHDPHEVTIQLDAVQLGDVRLSPAAEPHGAGRDASDGPVFVDASGRRGRTFRRLGVLLAVACAVYAVVIISTLLSGSSDAPWLPVPQNKDNPAGQVDISPLPQVSTPPSGTGTASPDPGTTASAGTTPSSAATAQAPSGSSGSAAAKPGASADARPTATRPTSATGGGTSGSSPDAGPSTPAGGTKPSQSTPAGGSSFPSPSFPIGGSAGTGHGGGAVAYGNALGA
jgi:cytoskeletal protein RodZ